MVSKQTPHSNAFNILLESEAAAEAEEDDDEDEDEAEDDDEDELDPSVDAFTFFLGGMVRTRETRWW
jgi:hypothetical protein